MPGEGTRASSCALVIRSLRTDSKTRRERGLRACTHFHRTAVGGWNPPLASFDLFIFFYDAAAKNVNFK